MSDVILTIKTAENTGPLIQLVHSRRGGPNTLNGFQPTHSQKGIYPFEKVLKFREPINLLINNATQSTGKVTKHLSNSDLFNTAQDSSIERIFKTAV